MPFVQCRFFYLFIFFFGVFLFIIWSSPLPSVPISIVYYRSYNSMYDNDSIFCSYE